MLLKPSQSPNAAAAPSLPGKGPALPASVGAAQGIVASGPSNFARMLEQQAQSTKLAAATMAGTMGNKAPDIKPAALLPNTTPPSAAAGDRRINDSGARREVEPRAESPAPRPRASADLENRRLIQRQAERNRLQAQSESRASAARSAPQQNAKAVKTSTAEKASDAASDKSAHAVAERSTSPSSQPDAAAVPWMQWPPQRSTDQSLSDESASTATMSDPALAALDAPNAASRVPVTSPASDVGTDKPELDTSDSLNPSGGASVLGHPAGGRSSTPAATGAIKLQGAMAPSDAVKSSELESLGNLLAGKLEQGGASRPGVDPTSVMVGAAEGLGRNSPIAKQESQDFAALLASQAGASQIDQSTPASVELSTPVHSPQFREHLGAQVSLLAKEGVQAAELHLNPADMGPISVQITLDGTQARVDFGADSASTRQLIEAGLPELASALREAGLTLSGGGVSQHARGRSDQERSDGQRPGAETLEAVTDAVAPPGPMTRRVALGGVDVFA